jgi:hypothetical protein
MVILSEHNSTFVHMKFIASIAINRLIQAVQ